MPFISRIAPRGGEVTREQVTDLVTQACPSKDYSGKRVLLIVPDGTRTAPARITKVDETENNAWFEIVLHQGKNQQIRRMFDLIGHSVVKLKRARIGFLYDERLRPGEWRRLSPQEVQRFMKGPRAKKTPPTVARRAR